MARPNVLLILVDDMGWRDLACTGSDFYETPHIDQLAQRGCNFTRAYASCPVCSPTRASLLTGKYPARVGITQYIGGHAVGKLRDVPYLYHLPRSETSLATCLRDNGYVTWHVGKWHLGEGATAPHNHGFDVNIGGGRPGLPVQGYFSPWGLPNLDDEEPGRYLTDALTDHALRLIDEHDSENTPFFLNYCAYAVHTPIQAPANLVAKYEEKARDLGLDQIDPMEKGERFPCLHKHHRHIQRRTLQSNPVYAAMVENLDANIGRLMDVLERKGQLDNTLVIFTSDNGGLSTAEGSPTCNLPLSEGKGWMYEGGNRVPLLMAWPGHIDAGSGSEINTTTPDLFHTCLAATGTPPPAGQTLDGTNLLPLLQTEAASEDEVASTPDRGPIFWHYPHYGNQGGGPAGAVVDGSWKLIEFYEDGGTYALFDLSDDEAESDDVASVHPDIVERLAGLLTAWREEVGALMPQPNPNWERLSREAIAAAVGDDHVG